MTTLRNSPNEVEIVLTLRKLVNKRNLGTDLRTKISTVLILDFLLDAISEY